MEKYKVLGQDLRGFYGAEIPLRQVFHDIERDLHAEKRVVCQYIVNGLAVEERDEDRYAQIPLAQIESLEYLSESTEVLLDEVLSGWKDAIPELQKATDALATRLKAGQTQGTLKAMHDLVGNCHDLVTSLASILELTAGSGPFRESFGALESSTHKVLREAVSFVERQDFVQLALAIEYDLNHQLQEWLEWVVKIGAADDLAAGALDRTGSSH